MKLQRMATLLVLAGTALAPAGFRAAALGQNARARLLVTVKTKGSHAAPPLTRNDVTVLVKNRPAEITGFEPMPAADLQLVFLFDDSARQYLALQIPSMQKLVNDLPAGAQVGVAYMANGSAQFTQPLTADHALAARGFRQTSGIPGISASPYFCLSSLAKHWPSNAPARRIVFMVTNGIDPYYLSGDLQDPYVGSAIADAQRAGVVVYSIYFHNRGWNGGQLERTYGQTYLLRVSSDTGGQAYANAMISPVSFDPFLAQFRASLDNQYGVTITTPGKGFQRIKVRSTRPGVQLAAPSAVYADAGR